jgi:penicillin-binding protein 1A
MNYLAKTLRLILTLFFIGCFFAAGIGIWLWLYIWPELPSVAILKQAPMQVPLRIYSNDGSAIAEYAEKRRIPINIAETPPLMIKAVLAIEDARFYDHPGIDLKGIIRAGLNMVKTGRIEQGASTITMQVARNFFLTRDKTFDRKIREMLLALRIENELSKNDILELYFNKIFLGHRAYGFAAAAQTYYGSELQNLTLAQYAMLAGLPQAPSANNPISNPKRALERRNYILARMLNLDYISQAAYDVSIVEPVTAKIYRFSNDLEAGYIAEMVRSEMVKRYGKEEAYTSGYNVYTTIHDDLQIAAQRSLMKTLQAYDTRHGYRGAVGVADFSDTPASDNAEAIQAYWDELLKGQETIGELLPALVMEVQDKSATVYTQREGLILLEWDGLSWARPYINEYKRGPKPKTAGDILKVGDVVHVYPQYQDILEKQVAQETPVPWRLAQIPQVEGALVALNPDNGAILALQGGIDYHHSKFNRITQAQRQPGSNFKPFVYSAALELGKTPASLINDAPVVFKTGNKIWRPENYSERSFGPTRLREALQESRNLVSIRLLYELGLTPVIHYLKRFGLEAERLPRDLTLALGTGSLTPLELVRGFTVFANGGHLIEPYFIERIETYDGEVVYQANPKTVCHACNLPLEIEVTEQTPPTTEPPMPEEEKLSTTEMLSNPQMNAAPRVITAQNAWLMTSILKDVIQHGTGTRAKVLGRTDIAGKTGTTNDQHDAWFSGYNADIAATVWVGFDSPKPMGHRETGGRAAHPMWIDFMRTALGDKPSHELPQPPGLVTVRINPNTGLLAYPGSANAILETFRSDNVPTSMSPSFSPLDPVGNGSGGDIF